MQKTLLILLSCAPLTLFSEAPSNASSVKATDNPAPIAATIPSDNEAPSNPKQDNTSVANEIATPPAKPQPNKPVNCDYTIAPEQKSIDPLTLEKWVKYAAIQSFSLSFIQLDKQMDALKKCYTKQGWQGFNEAMDKSGNLKAIEAQKLTLKSQIDGKVAVQQTKENQWKATVPLSVKYQNNKQKLTQLLSVDLIIGRKVSGDLGIMQMIATPRIAGENRSQTEPSQEVSQSE